MAFVSDSVRIDDLELARPDGAVARFGDVIEVPTVVVIARYYG